MSKSRSCHVSVSMTSIILTTKYSSHANQLSRAGEYSKSVWVKDIKELLDLTKRTEDRKDRARIVKTIYDICMGPGKPHVQDHPKFFVTQVLKFGDFEHDRDVFPVTEYKSLYLHRFKRFMKEHEASIREAAKKQFLLVSSTSEFEDWYAANFS